MYEGKELEDRRQPRTAAGRALLASIEERNAFLRSPSEIREVILAIEAEATAEPAAAEPLLGCYHGEPHVCRRCGYEYPERAAQPPRGSLPDPAEVRERKGPCQSPGCSHMRDEHSGDRDDFACLVKDCPCIGWDPMNDVEWDAAVGGSLTATAQATPSEEPPDGS